MFGSHSFCDRRASSFGASYYRGLAAREVVEGVILFTISGAHFFSKCNMQNVARLLKAAESNSDDGLVSKGMLLE